MYSAWKYPHTDSLYVTIWVHKLSFAHHKQPIQQMAESNGLLQIVLILVLSFKAGNKFTNKKNILNLFFALLFNQMFAFSLVVCKINTSPVERKIYFSYFFVLHMEKVLILHKKECSF